MRKVVARLPGFKQLDGWQDDYDQRYWLSIQGLSSPEELLEEQRRLERRRVFSGILARGSIAVLGGAVVCMILNPELIKQIPVETSMGGNFSLTMLGLGSAHTCWRFERKQLILQQLQQQLQQFSQGPT